MTKHLGLIILDGWGLGDGTSSDAIAKAHTPYMDELLLKYPNATLKTFGENVGLPDGQMGNSEVGHLNIGAGRIVYQELTRINKSIRERDFFSKKVLLEAMAEVKKRNSKLHLIGLVSKGGVHSSQEHLYALCELAKTQQVENNALQAVKTEINLAELSIKIINRLSLKSVTSKIQGNTIVKGDVFMLETIIENLIENAVKYSGTHPCINLYSFQNEKEIIFGVKDQGPGIPLTERENIFTKFYRIGNEETRSAKGSGLGLFIVSEFARLNGGSIQYKENLPKGAAFEVTLPL